MAYVYSTVDPDPPKYSLREFGRDMEREIDRGYDPVGLADWGWRIIMAGTPLEKTENYDLYDIIMELGIFAMEPEMYRTEEQMRGFAKRFQQGIFENAYEDLDQPRPAAPPKQENILRRILGRWFG